VSRGPGDVNRARFEAAVAAMGEPIKSRFEAGQAEDLLARTGWSLAVGGQAGPGRGVTDGAPAGAGRGMAAARRERLRSAGLLIATAAPRTLLIPRPPPRPPVPDPAPASEASGSQAAVGSRSATRPRRPAPPTTGPAGRATGSG